jgi:hypothetical protein
MADSDADDKRTILLEQWKGSVQFAVSFANNRLIAVSVGVPLVAALFVLSTSVKSFYPLLGIAVCMVAVAFAFREVVFSLNQATRVFMAECARIEGELGVHGFAYHYRDFLRDHWTSTGTFAFLWATRALSWGAVVASICLVWWSAPEGGEPVRWWAIVFTVVALPSAFALEFFYRRRWWADPGYPAMEKAGKKTSETDPGGD